MFGSCPRQRQSPWSSLLRLVHRGKCTSREQLWGPAVKELEALEWLERVLSSPVCACLTGLPLVAVLAGSLCPMLKLSKRLHILPCRSEGSAPLTLCEGPVSGPTGPFCLPCWQGSSLLMGREANVRAAGAGCQAPLNPSKKPHSASSWAHPLHSPQTQPLPAGQYQSGTVAL